MKLRDLFKEKEVHELTEEEIKEIKRIIKRAAEEDRKEKQKNEK